MLMFREEDLVSEQKLPWLYEDGAIPSPSVDKSCNRHHTKEQQCLLPTVQKLRQFSARQMHGLTKGKLGGLLEEAKQTLTFVNVQLDLVSAVESIWGAKLDHRKRKRIVNA